MNIITRLIDQLTQLVFGVPIFKVIEKAGETKSSFRHLDELAKRKKLSEAIKFAERILSHWSPNPSWLEKWLRKRFLGDQLSRLSECQQEWRKQLDHAKNLIQSARQSVKEAEDNPCDQASLSNLNKALNLYQQAEQVVYDVTLRKKIKDLEVIMKRHKAFQKKIRDAHELSGQLYFKEAISLVHEAKTLINAPELETKIADYLASVPQEEEYENSLREVRLLAVDHQWEVAIDLLKTALSQFARDDGKKILQSLMQTYQFQEQFLQAIGLEKVNRLSEAKQSYLKALQEIASVAESFDTKKIHIRLAKICIKMDDYQEALMYVKDLNCDESNYLRGFIYAKQKQWQQAGREWRKIHNPEVRSHLGILKTLIERDKLVNIQDIETDLKNRNHWSALEKSQLLLQKFGSDPVVEHNLNQHIEPWLTVERWNGKGSADLVDLSETAWLETPNITTLHNLTMALYEQIDQNAESVPFSLFSKFIGLWFTLLANLEHNPKLHNIAWMNGANIHLKNLQSKLIKVAEELMEKSKKVHPQQFELLRDYFRLELITLNIIEETNTKAIEFNQLTILPGCYHQYASLFPKLHLQFSHDQLAALYSDWGYAVAACLDNHIVRAIQIKLLYPPKSKAEIYSLTFVSYHEGRYHLQQFDWRESVKVLKTIQKSIQSNPEWQDNIDQLCSAQRRKIGNFNEHLEFAQFWYDLLQSQDAKSYLAEYKAEAIREQWAEDKISDNSALEKLNQLKKIDPNNPVVLDLYEKVKEYQEGKQFDKLLKAGNIDKLVNFAKRAHSQKIRFAAAELFIEMAVNGAEKQSLDFEGIRQFGKWAYEIAPNEPAFQDVYRALHIPY